MTEPMTKDIALVVDDSPESLSMINDTLDAAGMSVLVALEGSQAVSIAQNMTPDIILMDAIMPNMNGFEACKKIKSMPNLAHIPVVFMTGLSDTESIVKGFEAGGVDYIKKPINGDELIARIRVHLNNARMSMSARVALDSAGQFLITCTSNGEIHWITPQASSLLHEAGLDNAWISNELTKHLATLLIQNQTGVSAQKIDEGSMPLELSFVAGLNDGLFMIRLSAKNQMEGDEILQSNFNLTSREAQVLFWLARGKGNSDIAMILDVSPRTINKHLEQIFKKLNVENRTSAALAAFKALESIH